jgi:hypothetical protein
MRRVLLLCSTCLACTKLNPAFDEVLSDESEADTLTDTAEADSGTTMEVREDVPTEPACAFEPTAGLAIRFGDVEYFGACPVGVDAWVRVVGVEGGQLSLAMCGQGCDNICTGELPLTAFPLDVTQHIPPDAGDACMILQTSTLLGEDSSTCIYGSFSLHDPTSGNTHVLAISHSASPTSHGAGALGGLIPAPMKAGSCNCDEVGQSNDCCYQADGPPEFYYYPFDGTQLFPGDYIQVSLANQPAAEHYFHVYQAQHVRGCENPEPQLSWAVKAKF